MKYFLIFLTILLIACESKQNINIVGEHNGNPIFCISKSKHCDKNGLQVNGAIYMDEIDQNGDLIQNMWCIRGNPEKSNNNIIRKFEYGKLPEGWIEDYPAKKLVDGKLYRIGRWISFYRKDGVYYYDMKGKKSSFKIK